MNGILYMDLSLDYRDQPTAKFTVQHEGNFSAGTRLEAVLALALQISTSLVITLDSNLVASC